MLITERYYLVLSDPSIAHLYGIATKRSPTKFMLFDNGLLHVKIEKHYILSITKAMDLVPYNQFRNRVRGDNYLQFDSNVRQLFYSLYTG